MKEKNMPQSYDPKVAEGSSAVNAVLVTSANNTVVCCEGRDEFVCYGYSKFLIQTAYIFH